MNDHPIPGDIQSVIPGALAAAEDMIEFIAYVCHEVNRGYCEALGDNSQKPWKDTPDWQRSSVCNGVILYLFNEKATPEVSHEAWMREMEANDWVYGEEKNAIYKTHPCMVPFKKLPKEQQAKDHIFRAVVRALSKFPED